jgi:hypothetical protein
MKQLLFFFLLCSVSASAQTPNVNMPTTDNYHFTEWRPHIDTIRAGDTATTAPSNGGFNGNWTLLDSILYADKVGALGSALGFGWFADTSDGPATITNTTLARDMHYSTLTITGTLFPAGFRIFADSIFIGSAGAILDTGTAGTVGGVGDSAACGAAGNGNGGIAGAAQTGYGDGYLTRHMTTAGTAGGTGGTTGSGSTGQPGVTGTTVASGWGQAGVAGGNSGASGIGGGGSANNAGGTGGTAGTFTALSAASGSYRNLMALYLDRIFTTAAVLPRYSGFSGGGASGFCMIISGSITQTAAVEEAALRDSQVVISGLPQGRLLAQGRSMRRGAKAVTVVRAAQDAQSQVRVVVVVVVVVVVTVD